MRKRSYSVDPHYVTVKYACKCGVCLRPIAVGETAWYWPASRSMDCSGETCGAQSAREFRAARQDEDFMSAQFLRY